MVSLLRMPDTLSQPVSRQMEPPPSATAANEIMVEIRDVDFAYGNHQVLFDVDLHIPKCAVTAFIGPSGCGKTTLLRCINRMNDLIDNAGILQGSISVNGIDINAPNVDVVDLRRRV